LRRETATVLRVDRKRVLVGTADGAEIEARIRGRVAGSSGRMTSAVAVGDRVVVERADGGAVIAGVEPRKSVLMRPEVAGRWRRQVLVANADRAVLVFAQGDPEPAAGLVDRLLVACHAGGVPPVLVFNKADLAATQRAASLVRLYESLGYEVLRTSAARDEGLGRLAELLRGRSSVFAGPSGAGKSSLINRVLPGVRLRTGEISAASGKGRHTTTAAQLVRLPAGDGFVIDTPGVKEFGLLGIAPADLALHFPEFPVPNQCRFLDCRHDAEPGCRVRADADSGVVAPSRYESYRAFRRELEDETRREQDSPDRRRSGAATVRNR
jgi:ribosome biogenesis GTPase